MYTSYHLNSNELSSDFLISIKKLFKNKRILISIEEDLDETEYLLKSPANKKKIEKSIKNIEAGKTVSINLDSYLKK